MDINKIQAAVEAILFTMGDAVELDRMATALETDEETLKHVIENMMDKYESEERGIKIIEINGSYQMCSKASLYDSIVKIAHVPKKHVLTESLLETLSIVAYKQPITKSGIESIRGVNCEHAVYKLTEYNLIRELGRLDAPGRPILFGTTDDFLRNFGLSSIEDLPVVVPEKMEDFKNEAEAEVQLRLDL